MRSFRFQELVNHCSSSQIISKSPDFAPSKRPGACYVLTISAQKEFVATVSLHAARVAISYKGWKDERQVSAGKKNRNYRVHLPTYIEW